MINLVFGQEPILEQNNGEACFVCCQVGKSQYRIWQTCNGEAIQPTEVVLCLSHGQIAIDSVARLARLRSNGGNRSHQQN